MFKAGLLFLSLNEFWRMNLYIGTLTAFAKTDIQIKDNVLNSFWEVYQN